MDAKTYADVKLGANPKIGEYVILGVIPDKMREPVETVIGDNAVIRSHTVIYAGNQIGDNFNIWNCSTIDYGCTIGNDVKIHCNCYVAQFTVVEDNAFMAPGVTIANDIHPGCDFSSECMRGPHIEEGVEIGVNVTILPFVRIGAHSVIGSGTVITQDIPPGSVVVGNPGRVICSIHDLKCQSGLTDRPYKDILIHGSSAPQKDRR